MGTSRESVGGFDFILRFLGREGGIPQLEPVNITRKESQLAQQVDLIGDTDPKLKYIRVRDMIYINPPFPSQILHSHPSLATYVRT